MNFACVYIMANAPNGTLYVGVTSDLVRRVAEHRTGSLRGFTSQYGIKRLVYFESHDDINAAIAREKQLKKWRRDWKIDLIEQKNPHWDDLYEAILK
jgi:putative endonuclease